MLRNNTRDRSTIKLLNDRQNFLNIIKSKEYNLERQKELKKLLAEQNKKLFDLQNKKVKKIKQGRGKNLRGELARNKNFQRRFERGERRYAETQEPRIYGDPAPVMAGGVAMAPEDRQVAMARLQIQAQQNQNQFQLQDRRDREELAIRRGEAQGNLLLGQQRLAQDQEDQRGKRAIEVGRNNLDDFNNRERVRLDETEQQREEARQNRRMDAHEAEIEANVDFELERNRLRELEIENDRNIKAEEQALRRLQLESVPIPEINGGRAQPFNIGDHQFLGNLLTGLAQDRHRERDATQNIIRQFQEHQERLAGGLSTDIFNQLFQKAQASGLRVVGHQAPSGPNPNPPSIINLPDRSEIEDVGSNVRSILRAPSQNRSIEGTQTHGALTELELELARIPPPIPPPPPYKDLDNVQSFLQGATGDPPELDPDEISSITSTEFGRRVDRAEEELQDTSYGISRALEAERFNTENPFALVEVENPLDKLDLTPSESSNLRKDSNEQTNTELEALRQQGITTDRLAQLQEETEEIEEGAGVGILQQAGDAVGGALAQVAGGVADAGLGVLQGASQAIVDQLPTPSQVGQVVGRGAIDLGGALLQGAGGLAQAGLEAVVGGGNVEEVIEDLPEIPEATDEGELLEEVPISTLNTAEINDNDFDFSDFIDHHATESGRRGPPTLAQRARGSTYSIQNTTDRMHKKLSPGQKVDITSYGADAKGDTIGYFGAGGGVSAGGGNRRETKLQLQSLDKSITNGFLKLHKN